MGKKEREAVAANEAGVAMGFLAHGENGAYEFTPAAMVQHDSVDNALYAVVLELIPLGYHVDELTPAVAEVHEVREAVFDALVDLLEIPEGFERDQFEMAFYPYIMEKG